MIDILKAIGDPEAQSFKAMDQARLKAQLDGTEAPTRPERIKETAKRIPTKAIRGAVRVGLWYMSKTPSLDQQYAKAARAKMQQARRR